jgi:hypothetical protein
MFERIEPSDSPLPRPRFCPRCRKKARDQSALCIECGERLIDQGYCPVCEREWVQPVGSSCPKHEVPLESHRPPAWDDFTPDHDTSWVEVARFAHPSSALAPRLRLDSEGIPTFLDGERVALESAYNLAVGGVKLLVPADLADEARIILNQTWGSPPHPSDDPDDLDDAWEDLAPSPADRRRTVMKLIIVAILAFPLVEFLFRVLVR